MFDTREKRRNGARRIDLEVGLGPEIFTNGQMYSADAAAVSLGSTPDLLMEAAGSAVAEVIAEEFPMGTAAIFCGPGNNGGDGYVVARCLEKLGWNIRLGQFGNAPNTGEAGRAVQRWNGNSLPVDKVLDAPPAIIVDALFGAGLSRPLEGGAAALIDAINVHGAPIVSVDVPSGVDGDTGALRGSAVQAQRTVTFFRPKLGHCLLPGRARCGDVSVHDIGIPNRVLEDLPTPIALNRPEEWKEALRFPAPVDHKYLRGGVLVVGGTTMTGAARLAGRAARRVGAGLTMLATPAETFSLYAQDQAGFVPIVHDPAASFSLTAERRFTAVLVGPGLGTGDRTRSQVLACLESDQPVVIDADGLSGFADKPQDLIVSLRHHGRTILSPHEGEFARVFAATGTKVERAMQAARESHAVVIIKGYDTVIAAPDGRCRVNANAPPTLATAGSGDVLAGIILGLLGQGMECFEAACAGVWMHGAAAANRGLGLIAEDLVDELPNVLDALAEADANTVGNTQMRS